MASSSKVFSHFLSSLLRFYAIPLHFFLLLCFFFLFTQPRVNILALLWCCLAMFMMMMMMIASEVASQWCDFYIENWWVVEGVFEIWDWILLISERFHESYKLNIWLENSNIQWHVILRFSPHQSTYFDTFCQRNEKKFSSASWRQKKTFSSMNWNRA